MRNLKKQNIKQPHIYFNLYLICIIHEELPQGRRGCFSVFLFLVRLHQIPTLWEETILYRCTFECLGGWARVWLEGRGLHILSHSAFKNCTGNSVGKGNFQRPTGWKSVLMPESRPVPKSHEDVHEHARPTLNPQGGRFNTNQRKKPLRAQPHSGTQKVWTSLCVQTVSTCCRPS